MKNTSMWCRILFMELALLLVVGMIIPVNAINVSVAEVGGVSYDSLQEAIDAAGVEDEIDLLSSVVLTESLTVRADDVIILDLNGKTISQSKAQTGNYQMILVDGDLTVKDSVGGGKISYEDTVGGNFISNTITNRGTLTLLSGTIENTSSAAVANVGFPYAIDTSIWGAAPEVNIYIKGGTVTCDNYSALRLRADSETKAVNITITSGEVNGRIEVQNPTSNKASKGKLTISGDPVINKNNSSMAIMFFGGGGTAENLEAEISGGNISGPVGYSSYFPITGMDENIITGGTFDTDVSEFVNDDYQMVNNNGSFELVSASKFEIDKINMRFGNSLSLIFAFQQSKVTGSEYYASITRTKADGTPDSKVVPYAEWATQTIDDVDYWVVEYDGIAAKEMGDEVAVQIFNNKDKAVSNVCTTSVQAYAMSRLEKSENAEFKTLLVDMLNYGAAAQNQFAYDQENLVNALLTPEQLALGTSEMELCADTRTADNTYFVASNARFNNSINLIFMLKNVDTSMKAVFTYTDHYGKDCEVTVAGTEFETLEENYTVELIGLVVSDARQTVTCTIYDSSDAVVTTIVDSIESYVARETENTELCYSFMKFADSSHKFLH